MRRVREALFVGLTTACALAACAVLAGIVGTLLVKGLPALEVGFLFAATASGDTGILYQLLGTLLLVLTALVVSAPIAVAVALLRTVYLTSRRAQRLLDLGLFGLNGVPSILFGILGLLVFVNFLGWGKSWLAGGLVLGLMILPTLTVALVARIQALPRRYAIAAAGLGLSRARIIWSVILPQSWSGLVSGSLLGLARAAGETAPILFTAAVFAGATLPNGIRDNPVLALPYHVFVLAQDSFDPAAGDEMWATAFVLLALAFGLALAALPLRLREVRHG